MCRDIGLKDWSSLPDDVQGIIFAKATKFFCSNAGNIRLVSKTWRDTLRANYSGWLGCLDESTTEAKSKQLETVCRILPNATSLSAKSLWPIFLQPAEQLSCLREVDLSNSEQLGLSLDNHPVDLSLLPASVTTLTLTNIGVKMATIGQIRFALKALSISCECRKVPQILALLPGQSQLEVWSLSIVMFQGTLQSNLVNPTYHWSSNAISTASYNAFLPLFEQCDLDCKLIKLVIVQRLSLMGSDESEGDEEEMRLPLESLFQSTMGR